MALKLRGISYSITTGCTKKMTQIFLKADAIRLILLGAKSSLMRFGAVFRHTTLL
jgi:hypothetical protein